MALRLIEIFHRKGKSEEIDFLLKEAPLLDIRHDELPAGDTITKVLIKAESTESVLNILQDFFNQDDLRVVILPVEATLPRPARDTEEEGDKKKRSDRISTEELYQKLSKVSGLSRSYIVMAILASFVAAIGLIINDAAVIIGSMVIAPLLQPNMALSLATALGDLDLGKKAALTNIAGFSAVLTLGTIIGLIMDIDPATPQIALRSDVSHYYIYIALATGIAGAYSITAGVAEALVGVMVAVALLPPLVTAGLLFGSGHWINGTGALLLCLVNVVCINLTSVVTFIFQGIQPRQWRESRKARKAVLMSISLWVLLLILLAVIIYFTGR